MNEEEVLVGRIQDLAEQCYHRDVPSHTEFLTLAEQDLFYRTVNKIPGVRYVLSGGYEAAERKAALFLPSYAEDGDASMLPIAVVRIGGSDGDLIWKSMRQKPFCDSTRTKPQHPPLRLFGYSYR